MQPERQRRQRALLLGYWNIVEAKRCADGRVVRRQVLYLGEINESQREAWCRVIGAFDEDTQQRTQLAPFPAQREWTRIY